MVLAPALRLVIPPIAVALVLAGCGGSENLPPDTAAALVRNLDTIDKGVSAGECAKTRPALRRLQGRVRDLPKDVNPGVRTTLATGVTRLEDLFKSQCKQKPAPVAKAPTTPRVIRTVPHIVTPQISEPHVTTPTPPKVEAPTPPKIKAPTPPTSETPQQPQNGNTTGSTTGNGTTGQTGSTTGQTDTCGTSPSSQC
jgi:hypothetical protein